MHPKGNLFRINQRNFWLVLTKDSVDSWILFLTVPIRLSIFYHGRFVFFVRKTVFSASAPHKMIKNTFVYWILHFTARFSLKYCKNWWKSRIGTFGKKTLGYLDRNGSKRFQNVWKFLFNLLWTLSIIAIMDAVHVNISSVHKTLKNLSSENLLFWDLCSFD
jgi:hypothetical protein